MDFFDPQKQKRHAIRMGVGYALIALALALATTILLYQAFGFGVNRKGQIIQNGLVFLSSQPQGADIIFNGLKNASQTNTRSILPAGQYTVQLKRTGYRTWQRAISVDGGVLERFDYPFLFPLRLATTAGKTYSGAPSLLSQSNDRRWLLLAEPGANAFDLYDLNASKPSAKLQIVPSDILADGTNTLTWQTVEWASDNRHVLLRRNYQSQQGSSSGSEYVLYDRQDPAQSKNLTTLLGFTPSTIELKNGAYDQYFAFDQNAATLFTASLKKPTPQLYLEQVLNFTTDKNTVLYATTEEAPAGKVLIRLRQNSDPSYLLQTLSGGSSYLLDLATYKGLPFAAVSASGENTAYVYKDPLATLKKAAHSAVAPVQILKVTAPNYLKFSASSRFVLAENNDKFSVYDAETDKGYTYQAKITLDAGQQHAAWMDGNHVEMVSDGKLQIFDFDNANAQSLMPANAAYLPAFSPNYHYLYTITAANTLSSTPLLTPEDL